MTDDGFREFVELRYADLLRTAYLLTGSRHAAEDLVQNALMQAMRRWRQVDEPMAYVRRIMVNERVSLWHRFGSREFLAGVTGAWRLHADRGRSRDVADDVVVRAEVRDALRGLPARRARRAGAPGDLERTVARLGTRRARGRAGEFLLHCRRLRRPAHG
ncbi:sigma factor [Micromonospora rubida]|uniref:sigma factor n=1 Tax=Micromonospora rubida TaxID=2697657 RepID=UPI00137903D1|nr:sigma factor [Micromonospora rubida]NBE80147.1 hypothetical protein [Micromonospora rubida]